MPQIAANVSSHLPFPYAAQWICEDTNPAPANKKSRNYAALIIYKKITIAQQLVLPIQALLRGLRLHVVRHVNGPYRSAYR